MPTSWTQIVQRRSAWLRECTGRLKNRKAPAICGITVEMLKVGGDVVAHWLHRIFCMSCESGTVPAEWRKAQIMRLRTEVGQ